MSETQFAVEQSQSFGAEVGWSQWVDATPTQSPFVGVLALLENFPQRLVHFQPAIVANVALLSKVIHKKIDSGTGGANHVSENLVIWIGDLRNGRALSI